MLFSSPISYFNYLYSILSPGGLLMLLFSLLISVCQDYVQFLPFIVEVLSKLYQSYSFSILFNRSVVSSAQVIFILSSLVSLFNRSAVRIRSSLIPFLNRRVFNTYLPFNLKVFRKCSLSLFANRVFSTLFTFVVFFSRICST